MSHSNRTVESSQPKQKSDNGNRNRGQDTSRTPAEHEKRKIVNRKISFLILAGVGFLLLVLAIYFKQFEQILSYV